MRTNRCCPWRRTHARVNNDVGRTACIRVAADQLGDRSSVPPLAHGGRHVWNPNAPCRCTTPTRRVAHWRERIHSPCAHGTATRRCTRPERVHTTALARHRVSHLEVQTHHPQAYNHHRHCGYRCAWRLVRDHRGGHARCRRTMGRRRRFRRALQVNRERAAVQL